jgi:glucan phosphoethanolaminetransferase (alkaline phosphatase superfamily)
MHFLVRRPSRILLSGSRLAGLLLVCLAGSALAQSVDPTAMGQGFFAYARPYVIWAGAAMVLLCVAAATFYKPLLKDALVTAAIVVMLVFLFNTFPDLVRALSH